MNLKTSLGTNISMLFLLGLTLIVAVVWHVASGGTDKIQNKTRTAEIVDLL